MRKNSRVETFLILYPHIQHKGNWTVLECNYCETKFISLFFTDLQKWLYAVKENLCVYVLGILICLKYNK